MKKLVSILMCLVIAISTLFYADSKAEALTSKQKDRADLIARICIDNWDRYGVLPSVCIGQAMMETGLGTAYNNGNLWGICSGRVSYSSISEGCRAYLRVINNGYYKNAPFKKSYRNQLWNILYDKNGNAVYCQPAGSYYRNVCSMIQRYGWYKYDRQLFKELKIRKARKLKRRMRKKQGQTFKVVIDSKVPVNEAWVSKKVSKQKGTVQIKTVDGFDYYEIYDLKTKNIPDNEVHVNTTYCTDKKVKLEFKKGAKG